MNKIKIILKEKEFPNLVIKNEVKVLIDENISWEGLPYSELTAFCPLEYQKEVNIEHEVISITSENFNSKIQQKIQNGLDAFNKDLDEFNLLYKSIKKILNNKDYLRKLLIIDDEQGQFIRFILFELVIDIGKSLVGKTKFYGNMMVATTAVLFIFISLI